MEIFLIALFILLSIVLVILIRALMFKPKEVNKTKPSTVNVSIEKATNRLSTLIQIKTVTDIDKNDETEFERFRDKLKELYPKVFENSEYELIKPRGMLISIKGEDSNKATVLMSHYDVVSANEKLWSVAPFSGQIDNGYIWGRGTLDTKGTLCAIMEAIEFHLIKGFKPKYDLYLAFSGDEETSGQSAPNIVKELESRGVTQPFVIDEGGAIVERIFPGVDDACAVIGTGEKGYMDVLLSVKSKGGHSSSPPVDTPIDILAAAVLRLKKQPFKYNLTRPTLEMFDTLGRKSNLTMKLLFSNMWLFKPILARAFTKMGGEMNAMIRTTMVPTLAKGSSEFNVIPPEAKIGLNLRILAPDTVESCKAKIIETVNDKRVEVSVVENRDATPISKTDSWQWELLKQTVEENWEGVLVSPYLMLAASDSRHYSKISDYVFRFSAMKLTKEELRLIHGNDERISQETFSKIIEFYIRLIHKL